jgi:hypothetical protein
MKDRIALSIVIVVAVVAGCSSPAAVARPTGTPTAAVTAAPTTSDADKTAMVVDNIETVYGTDPRPAWYRYLAIKAGHPDVAVEGTSLFVGAKRSIPKTLAKEMCADIATAAFDDNAKPIGFRHVHVQTGPDSIVADCDTRT